MIASRGASSIAEPVVVRWILTLLALAFLAVFLCMPLAVLVHEALKKGIPAYLAAITTDDTCGGGGGGGASIAEVAAEEAAEITTFTRLAPTAVSAPP